MHQPPPGAGRVSPGRFPLFRLCHMAAVVLARRARVVAIRMPHALADDGRVVRGVVGMGWVRGSTGSGWADATRADASSVSSGGGESGTQARR